MVKPGKHQVKEFKKFNVTVFYKENVLLLNYFLKYIETELSNITLEIEEFGDKNGLYQHGDLLVLKVKAIEANVNETKLTNLKFL